MEKRLILYVSAITATGIVLFLVGKRIIDRKKRIRQKKNVEEIASRQHRRSKSYYGEYTL